MYNVGGIQVYGGTYPARIWHEFMNAALGDGPAVGFPAPEPTYSSRYLSIDNEFQPPGRRRTPVPIASDGSAVVVPEPVPTPAPGRAEAPGFTIPAINLPELPVITVPDRRTRPGR